ncbi:DNA internalization-related competence protein ComEC/Rec2 [Paraburkholderia ginsengiterrae]|uniref:DNA internalization-related competence protein ComEC/Rec2 n=1 Tax=Paraburkholderia ginsengiterrae TaxID=1462993 RepID=A0A1A9N4P0_9BURK|nr:DNA internalization-related competence protein ComEC/Rec2 [Paraburkholderia ginsengiterrae]OAJ56574.1 DNA internalization-related competence protein ComEC/Rec2 [Paraburkholderia ginsengiterrae]OAJ57862.1 DNA internalization-related competence protein ComEC/Rec2 [Paraburkholderia ginsengiterrae]
MRAWWCGFALGVIWLQRQAALPVWTGWCGLALLGGASVVVAAWGLRARVADLECGCSEAAASVRAHGAAIGKGLACRAWLNRRVRSCAGWGAIWCAAMCAGFGYAALRADQRLAVSLPGTWEGRNIDIVGSIKGLPSHDEKGARFLFSVEKADMPGVAFPPVIQLSWIAEDAPPPLLEPGARWRLTVRLKRPHGNANFGVRDTEVNLLARNVRATGYVSAPAHAARLAGRASGVGVMVDRLRATLRARIDAVLADAPHRGIVVALAIGAQDEVSAADWLLMRGTGTSHLVAISGLHIGFVAGLAGWLAGALWRRSAWIGRNWPLRLPAQIVAVTGGALFAALHAALAGFNVPAQRALWMAGVLALAFVSGREVARSVVLAWALGLVLLIDPWAVTSAGFWLSFCAVAAILFAMSGRPRVQDHEQHRDEAGKDAEAPGRWLRLCLVLRRRWRGAVERLRGATHVQFAVTVALAPLTVYWFGQIPLIGPLANAFAIPWVSVLVTPAVLAGIALPAPLDVHAWRFAHALLDLLATGLQMLSGPAWTLWRLPQPDAWTLAAAALGVLWCLAPSGWPLRWAAPLTWLPLLMPAPSGPPHGSFRLTALDIGQGTSVLIETAHHTLLFDTGPGPESTHAGERVVVPFLQAQGVKALDTLVISHADSDHSGGAPAVLQAIQVHQMVAALAPSNALWAAARQRGADTLPCAAGQRWQWDGVEFAMLWPDAGPLRGRPNAHCCVLRVSAPLAGTSQTNGRVQTEPRRITALLTADIEAPTERILLSRDPAMLRAQVLVVPHHGSKTSSTEPFLDSIEPLVALFQVGYRNRFHHPNAGVFERYKARHIELGRSDTDGAVRVEVVPDDRANGDARTPGVALKLERYRDTQRRYWMDR